MDRSSLGNIRIRCFTPSRQTSVGDFFRHISAFIYCCRVGLSLPSKCRQTLDYLLGPRNTDFCYTIDTTNYQASLSLYTLTVRIQSGLLSAALHYNSSTLLQLSQPTSLKHNGRTAYAPPPKGPTVLQPRTYDLSILTLDLLIHCTNNHPHSRRSSRSLWRYPTPPRDPHNPGRNNHRLHHRNLPQRRNLRILLASSKDQSRRFQMGVEKRCKEVGQSYGNLLCREDSKG